MKNMTVPLLVLASAFSLFTVNAHADTFSYTYVEAGIATADADTGDDDSYAISGSYDVAPNINVLGAITNIDQETGGLENTFNTYELGVGYHTQVAEKTDATADVRAIKVEGVDDTGFGVGVGLRHLFADQVEGNAGLGYTDVNDQTDTSISVGGRYYFSNNVSAGLDYSKTNKTDADTWEGTLRMNFL